jgi:hypothetical protein
LARLAALVPPPRHPLIRFHGVLAPHSSWRACVVPVDATPKEATARSTAQEAPARQPSGFSKNAPDVTRLART